MGGCVDSLVSILDIPFEASVSSYVYRHNISMSSSSEPTTVSTPPCVSTSSDYGGETVIKSYDQELTTDQEKQEGDEIDSTSTCLKRGRFTLELVSKTGHLPHSLAVTHANCDPALSPVPTTVNLFNVPPPKMVVKKVGRFVIEEEISIDTVLPDSPSSSTFTHLSSGRRIGRFEVAPHDGRSGRVTPTLMVYPVLDRSSV